MTKTLIISFGIATSLAVGRAAGAEQLDMDHQITAAVKEIKAQNYFKAGVLLVQAETQARLLAGSELPAERLQSVFHSPADPDAVLALLSDAAANYKNRNWTEALYDLSSAGFATARLDARKDPGDKFKLDATEAEREMSPPALHRAARSAIAAGLTAESLKYAGREITTIPSMFPGLPGPLMLHRAYTLLGIAYLRGNDVVAATKALSNSLDALPEGAFSGAFGSNMALAKELLAKGRTNDVLDYIDKCVAIGGSDANQQNLHTWRTPLAQDSLQSSHRSL